MIAIGNFFFKYRNFVFPVFALSIFIPGPQLFPESVFGENHFWIPLISELIIAVAGQAIRAITIGLKYIVRGGKNKKVYAEDLVVEGMFKHCRNPLYVGNILMLLGAGIVANSIYFILIAFPIFCFIYQAIVLAEENYLRQKFGAQYETYTQTVNRWLPSLSGIRSTFSSMTFNWKRYIVSECNTIYVLLVSLYLVMFMHYRFLQDLPGIKQLQISSIVIGIFSLLYMAVRIFKTAEKSKRKTGTSV